MNTMVQGSAADLMKSAMVRLDAALRLPEFVGSARLVLMVHDEVLLEVRTDRVACVASLVHREMEGAMRLSIPTPVAICTGLCWGHLKPFSSPQS